MKYNLKNKPRMRADDIKEWFEGFEAELREMYRGKDFSAKVLIQHILCKSGDEILGEQ